MRDKKFYDAFSMQWIDAWNSHDIQRILRPYDDSFELSSPVLAKLYPDSGGKLKGKQAIGSYWSKALAARPDLKFELLAVLKGVDSAVIHYRGYAESLCAEFFIFNADGLVVKTYAHGE